MGQSLLGPQTVVEEKCPSGAPARPVCPPHPQLTLVGPGSLLPRAISGHPCLARGCIVGVVEGAGSEDSQGAAWLWTPLGASSGASPRLAPQPTAGDAR